MSGDINGLQTRIREVEQRALFVHCRAHTLNLVVQDEIGGIAEVVNVMGIIQKCVAFARGSPERLAWFKKFQDESESQRGTSYRPFCPTMWVMRKPTLVSLTSNYKPLLEFLRDLKINKDFSRCRVDVAGFLSHFEKFDKFFILETLRQVFTILEDTSTQLQGSQLNFGKAESIITTLKGIFETARSSNRFDTLWNAATISAQNMELDQPELPRKRRMPARKTVGTAEPYFPLKPEDTYRQLYFRLVDVVIAGLSNRFEPTETTQHLRKVEEFLTGSLVAI